MTEKASAVIHVRFPSERETNIIESSLKPETESSPTHRSIVQIERRGRTLKLLFKSKDTTALRASINSYLSWLQLLTNVYNTLESRKLSKNP